MEIPKAFGVPAAAFEPWIPSTKCLEKVCCTVHCLALVDMTLRCCLDDQNAVYFILFNSILFDLIYFYLRKATSQETPAKRL